MPYFYRRANPQIGRKTKISAVMPEFPPGIAGFKNKESLEEATWLITSWWGTFEGAGVPIEIKLIPLLPEGFSIKVNRESITLGLSIAESSSGFMRYLTQERAHRKRGYIYALLTLMEISQSESIPLRRMDFEPAFPLRIITLNTRSFFPSLSGLEDLLFLMTLSRLNTLYLKGTLPESYGSRLSRVAELLGINIVREGDLLSNYIEGFDKIKIEGYPLPHIKEFKKELIVFIEKNSFKSQPGGVLEIDFEKNQVPIQLLWLPILWFGSLMWSSSLPEKGSSTRLFFGLSENDGVSSQDFEELIENICRREISSHLNCDSLIKGGTGKRTALNRRKLISIISLINELHRKARRNRVSLELLIDLLKISSELMNIQRRLGEEKALLTETGDKVNSKDKTLSKLREILSSAYEEILFSSSNLLSLWRPLVSPTSWVKTSGDFGKLLFQINALKQLAREKITRAS